MLGGGWGLVGSAGMIGRFTIKENSLVPGGFICKYQDIWALTQQNISSGFPTEGDSNQSPQLPRQARKLKFRS